MTSQNDARVASPELSPQDRILWQQLLRELNRHNLYCACDSCGYEWVDSQTEMPCPRCHSQKIQVIPCWQFPDD